MGKKNINASDEEEYVTAGKKLVNAELAKLNKKNMDVLTAEMPELAKKVFLELFASGVIKAGQSREEIQKIFETEIAQHKVHMSDETIAKIVNDSKFYKNLKALQKGTKDGDEIKNLGLKVDTLERNSDTVADAFGSITREMDSRRDEQGERNTAFQKGLEKHGRQIRGMKEQVADHDEYIWGLREETGDNSKKIDELKSKFDSLQEQQNLQQKDLGKLQTASRTTNKRGGIVTLVLAGAIVLTVLVSSLSNCENKKNINDHINDDGKHNKTEQTQPGENGLKPYPNKTMYNFYAQEDALVGDKMGTIWGFTPGRAQENWENFFKDGISGLHYKVNDDRTLSEDAYDVEAMYQAGINSLAKDAENTSTQGTSAKLATLAINTDRGKAFAALSVKENKRNTFALQKAAGVKEWARYNKDGTYRM